MRCVSIEVMGDSLKKRGIRLLIGYLVFMQLAVMMVFMGSIGYVFLKGMRFGGESIGWLGLIFLLESSLFVLFFLSLPAIIYSVLMEFVINPRVVCGRQVVLMSTLLVWLFAVLGIGLFLVLVTRLPIIYGVLTGLCGCLVGFFSGCWLCFIYRKQQGGQILPRWCVVINAVMLFYFVMVMIGGVWLFIGLVRMLDGA